MKLCYVFLPVAFLRETLAAVGAFVRLPIHVHIGVLYQVPGPHELHCTVAVGAFKYPPELAGLLHEEDRMGDIVQICELCSSKGDLLSVLQSVIDPIHET